MLRILLVSLALAAALDAQPAYDLLLKGGHVIDPKNHVSKVLDVAIADGKIARVAPNIPAAQAKRSVDAAGLYVTPGLLDIHVHVYMRPAAGSSEGNFSVPADAFSFRSGVTTMVDAGTAGWREVDQFRRDVVKASRTRVLAFLNIVGAGMGSGKENDPAEMDPEGAARAARDNRDVVVGFKSAHYDGPGWPSIENAVKAGKLAEMPVMVDFGRINEERNINALLLDKLRPGDIYTHCYSGRRRELQGDGKINPAMYAGRKRGIIFDIGHGSGSFYWYVAIPAYQQGFRPDSISTDLHTGSMNGGMKDMANTMAKILALGSPLDEVIRMSTWAPAQEIRHPELGNLDVGADADVAVLRVDQGRFGYLDSALARQPGTKAITCELTLRHGQVVWDLNGRAANDWHNDPEEKRGWAK